MHRNRIGFDKPKLGAEFQSAPRCLIIHCTEFHFNGDIISKLLTVVIDVRYEGQPGKLSEIQSDPSRVTTRVARLGPRLLFCGAFGAIRVVFSHFRSLLLL